MGNVIDFREFIQYVGALFAMINPVGIVPVLLALTDGYSTSERRKVAAIATATVLATLMVASLLGREILYFFAISPDLFRVAGGLMILLIAISMVLRGGQQGPPPQRQPDHNPAVVPLGIPLLAGPGAIATAILYASHHHENWANTFAHVAGIVVVTLATSAR